MSRRCTTNFYGIWKEERSQGDSYIARVELLIGYENIALAKYHASSFRKKPQTNLSNNFHNQPNRVYALKGLLQRKPEGIIGEKSKRQRRVVSFPHPIPPLSFPLKYSTISSKHDLPPRGRLGTHTASLPGPPCRLMDLMRKTTLDQPLSGWPPCLPRQDRSTNKVYLQNTP